MASCFDISIIDAWNTGDEDVTNGSVDNYDFDWGGSTPPCGCRRTCCTRPSEEPVSEDTCTAEEMSAEVEEDYPIVQL